MTKSHAYSETATPVVIAGAPRSGTTFLTVSLNAHPQILITNELRIWSVFNDLRLRLRPVSELLPEHPLRDRFRKEVDRSNRRLFRDFYRKAVDKTNVGCPTGMGESVEPVIRAYGDKNPGYADPHQRGCMDFIARMLPEAKFIHIVRDPRSSAASYKAVDVYPDKIGKCIDLWTRHTETMARLVDRLGPERAMELRYEDYAGDEGEALFQRMEAFLGVDHAAEPIDFLRRERALRVPYRSPVTPIEKLGGTSYQDRLTPEEIAKVETSCADLMARYDYAAGETGLNARLSASSVS